MTENISPAKILYTNGPFAGVQSTMLPDPPPETLTGDAYMGMRADFRPIYERMTYYRYDCIDDVWLYEVRL